MVIDFLHYNQYFKLKLKYTKFNLKCMSQKILERVITNLSAFCLPKSAFHIGIGQYLEFSVCFSFSFIFFKYIDSFIKIKPLFPVLTTNRSIDKK